MYNAGAPLGGGVIGAGVLAATGFNGFAITLLAVMFLLGGLVLLRWAMLRHNEPAVVNSGAHRALGQHGARRRRH